MRSYKLFRTSLPYRLISNTRNPTQLLEWNLEEVKQNGKSGKFLNNQFVLKPGVGNIGDIVALELGFSSLQPDYMANE